jgi:hypothetical protein
MLVWEAHDRYFQGFLSIKKGWNVIAFKNLIKKYGHIDFTESYAIE